MWRTNSRKRGHKRGAMSAPLTSSNRSLSRNGAADPASRKLSRDGFQRISILARRKIGGLFDRCIHRIRSDKRSALSTACLLLVTSGRYLDQSSSEQAAVYRVGAGPQYDGGGGR